MTKPSHQRILEEIRHYWQEILREGQTVELESFSCGLSESTGTTPADRTQEPLAAAIRPAS